jgi:hypothetical protein
MKNYGYRTVLHRYFNTDENQTNNFQQLTTGGAKVILNSISAAGGSVPLGGCTLKTESTSGTLSFFLPSGSSGSDMSGL